MACRIVLLATAIVAAASLASAQTSQPTLAKSEQQDARSKPCKIILDVSFLYLREGIAEQERAFLNLPILPKKGDSIILDGRQCQSLIFLTEADRRSYRMRMPAIQLANGEKREAWPENDTGVSETDRRLSQTCQTTVSDDQRSIHVALSWNRPEPRPEFIPETKATVPLGSHWLIHTASIWHSRTVTYQVRQNVFEQAAYWLKHGEPKTAQAVGRELVELYLLVTPRLASSEPKQASAAADGRDR